MSNNYNIFGRQIYLLSMLKYRMRRKISQMKVLFCMSQSKTEWRFEKGTIISLLRHSSQWRRKEDAS